MRRRAVLGLLLAACSGGPDAGEPTASLSPLPPDRAEYRRFRALHPDLEDPNYLPFVLHRLRLAGTDEERIVVCRWPLARFPLAVAVEAPEIPAELDDEERPTPPGVYVLAVERALRRWEEEVGAPIRFRAAGEGETPDLQVRLVGERAPSPDPEKAVLGMTPLQDACRVRGAGEDDAREVWESDVLDVEFTGPPEVRIFVADEFGLLTPEQVEAVATHELGHALGARAHSPFAADLMYEVARDRLGRTRLSPGDVRTFRALYALPNGTVYARRKAGAAPSPRGLPDPGEPRLEAAREEPALGLGVRWPAGWTRLDIERGVAVVDGVAWDHDASLQLAVVPVESVDAYLEAHADAHFGFGPVLEQEEIEVAGRPGLRFVQGLRARDSVEELVLVDLAPGRVLRVLAETPRLAYPRYRPWLEAVLAGITLRFEEPPRASDRP